MVVAEIPLVMGFLSLTFSLMYIFADTKALRFIMKYMFFVFAIITTLTLSTLAPNENYLPAIFDVEFGILILLLLLDFFRDLVNFISLIFLGKKVIKDVEKR